MKLYLKIWRQSNADSDGNFQNYEIEDIQDYENLMDTCTKTHKNTHWKYFWRNWKYFGKGQNTENYEIAFL